MRIGLFFGTFNPIHVGHLIIANYMAHNTDLEQVWLVVTPHNPHKDKSTLLADHHRYYMCQLAIEDNPKLRVSNIEFKLPQPSYTVVTLAELRHQYPQHQFILIMGEDNLMTLHKWKNPKEILTHHQIYVYPRKGNESFEREFKLDESIKSYQHRIKMFNLPLIHLSASFIRKCIRENKNVRYLIPDKIYNYIKEMHFYE